MNQIRIHQNQIIFASQIGFIIKKEQALPFNDIVNFIFAVKVFGAHIIFFIMNHMFQGDSLHIIEKDNLFHRMIASF